MAAPAPAANLVISRTPRPRQTGNRPIGGPHEERPAKDEERSMSALRVAAQRGTTWPRLPVAAGALALTVGLVAGVALGATTAGRATTQSAISTTPTTPAARTHAAGAPATASMAAY